MPSTLLKTRRQNNTGANKKQTLIKPLNFATTCLIDKPQPLQIFVLPARVREHAAFEARTHLLPMRERVGELKSRAVCASYIDNNGWFRQFDRALINRNFFTCLDEVLNVQVDSLAKICQGLVMRMPPGVTTL